MIYRNAKQGTATHTEVHRDTGPARGPMSPIKAGHYSDIQPVEGIVHRDEDYASAGMERIKKGSIPETNRRGGVTSAAPGHGSRGTMKDQGDWT